MESTSNAPDSERYRSRLKSISIVSFVISFICFLEGIALIILSVFAGVVACHDEPCGKEHDEPNWLYQSLAIVGLVAPIVLSGFGIRYNNDFTIRGTYFTLAALGILTTISIVVILAGSIFISIGAALLPVTIIPIVYAIDALDNIKYRSDT